jgi:hypothetical protein
MPQSDRNCRVHAQVSRFATEHGGVIADWHLVEFGLGMRTVQRWVRSGRLFRRYPGVYAVGHEALSPKGRALAAVWACGPRALLSHQAAGARWEILKSNRAVWDVTVPGRSRRGPRDIHVHTSNLHPGDCA